jgi:alpha-glucoside transport system permease protein
VHEGETMTTSDVPVADSEDTDSGSDIDVALEAGAAPIDEAGTSITARRIALLAVAIVVLALAVAAILPVLTGDGGGRFTRVGLALLVGTVGIFAVFWAMDTVVDRLPRSWRATVRPYVFVGPALVILGIFLVYPVVNTIYLSLRDANGTSWVWLDNFRFVFTDESMLRSMRNTLGWIIIVPTVSTTIGLVFATLADRLNRGEAVAKSLIFLPMAISFVGAAVVWQFVYNYRPAGFGSNIGLANGVWGVFGGEPVSWLALKPWNNFMLMFIMIWMQTGFAMVVLSAAIKSVPDEIEEAARIDGASEWQVFSRIIVPSILPTIVVVSTYMVINALKVFDIVFVMGSTEANGTEVIAERMIRNYFLASNSGRGAAIAVVLFMAVIPVMFWNIRQFRQQEAQR